MATTELSEGYKAIKTRLSQSAALVAVVSTRIYRKNKVPSGAGEPIFPYVLIDFAAGTNLDGAGTRRIAGSLLYLVRVVNKLTPSPVATGTQMQAAEKAIDDALQTTVRLQSGGYVVSIRQQAPYENVYRLDGNTFEELGGFYRAFVASV